MRYRHTLLGAAWAVLQPALTMAVFAVLFGQIGQLSPAGVPYPLFAYLGLVPWMFFSQVTTQGSTSLINSASLLTKVYFPRALLPAAVVGSAGLDLALALLMAGPLMAFYGRAPSPGLVLLPAFLALALALAVGLALWLSAVCVQYRDVRHTIPFVVQLGLFVTPVIYPLSLIRQGAGRFGLPGWVGALNPVAGPIEGIRWAVLGGELDGTVIAASVALTAAIVAGGWTYFRSAELSLADTV